MQSKRIRTPHRDVGEKHTFSDKKQKRKCVNDIKAYINII